jgi:hypothetical protein
MTLQHDVSQYQRAVQLARLGKGGWLSAKARLFHAYARATGDIAYKHITAS